MITMVIIIFIMFLISIIMIILNMITSKYSYSMREKKSIFECGFETFQSMRLPFSIHFFLSLFYF